MCETEPIRPGRQDGRVAGRGECAKQTQFCSGSTPCNRVQSRRTKPIWAGRVGTGGTECAKQTQLVPADRQSGLWQESIVRNKANSTKPPSRTGCNGTKQTQFPPGVQESVGQAGPQTRSAAFGSPTHPTRGCNCAKQTQFGPAGRPGPWERQMYETKPIPVRRADSMEPESATVCWPRTLATSQVLGVFMGWVAAASAGLPMVRLLRHPQSLRLCRCHPGVLLVSHESRGFWTNPTRSLHDPVFGLCPEDLLWATDDLRAALVRECGGEALTPFCRYVIETIAHVDTWHA